MYDPAFPLAYYYSWENVPDAMLPNIMAEFREHGVKNLVFSHVWLTRIIHDMKFWSFIIQNARKLQMNLVEAHAPCGQGYDLCCPERGRHPHMIEEHKRAMNYCAESGCRTYTIHVGAFESAFFQIPNEKVRPIVLDSLEKLLPEAEKLGIVIAVENSYERSNTPDEVVAYVEHFKSPSLGCCFDAGHAHVMEPFPGKQRSRYCDWMNTAWAGQIEEYSGALERMAPYIVTCHLHDNDGYGDAHSLPGEGTIDWNTLIPKIKQLPRLISMQTEVRTVPGGLAVGKLVRKFQSLMNEK